MREQSMTFNEALEPTAGNAARSAARLVFIGRMLLSFIV